MLVVVKKLLTTLGYCRLFPIFAKSKIDNLKFIAYGRKCTNSVTTAEELDKAVVLLQGKSQENRILVGQYLFEFDYVASNDNR